MMKKLRMAILVTFIVILYSIPVCAGMDMISDADEWEMIKEVVRESGFFDGVEMGNNGTTSNYEELGDSATANQSYKLYLLLTPDFINYLADGYTVEKLLTDEYVWIVPSDSNKQVRVAKKDSEWKVVGYSTPSALNSVTDMIQVAEARDLAQTISANEALKKMQCFEAPMYHTNFVLLTLEDGYEQLIPYGSRPDLTGLENGKVYSVAEVCDILGKTFGSDSDLNSGMPALNEDSTRGKLLKVVLIVGGVALAGGLILKWRKIRR